MTCREIVNVKSLMQKVTHRKRSTENRKVEWLKVMQLQVTRDSPFQLKYKYTHNPNETIKTLDIRNRTRGQVKPLGLTHFLPLYPEERTVQEAKVKDLLTLMEFVPAAYADFYRSIKPSDTQEDGGVVDAADDIDCE